MDDEATTKRPGDPDDDVADWFDTRTDPEIAAAVAKAEAIATRGISGDAAERSSTIGGAAGSNGSPTSGDH